MAESKKRYPGQDLYKALHKFFNQNHCKSLKDRRTFEEVVEKIGYKFEEDNPKKVSILLPDGSKSVSERRSLQVRLSEVIEDMDRRLKAHGYTWSVKEGQKKYQIWLCGANTL